MPDDSKIMEWLKPQSEDEIRSLLERARRGDSTDLAALRQALYRAHPHMMRIAALTCKLAIVAVTAPRTPAVSQVGCTPVGGSG